MNGQKETQRVDTENGGTDMEHETTVCFDATFDQEDALALYDHLGAICKIIGLEWKPDQNLNGDAVAAYIRSKGQDSGTLITGSNLPRGLSGIGGEAEIAALARGIAMHLAARVFGPWADVRALWTWKQSDMWAQCPHSCHIEEALHPCSQCRMSDLCRLVKSEGYCDRSPAHSGKPEVTHGSAQAPGA